MLRDGRDKAILFGDAYHNERATLRCHARPLEV